jgi:predicted transcriptional regulator
MGSVPTRNPLDATEQQRFERTLEALRSVDDGRTFNHEEVLAHLERRRRKRMRIT